MVKNGDSQAQLGLIQMYTQNGKSNIIFFFKYSLSNDGIITW